MGVFVEDHSLIIHFSSRAFIIRPCNSIDGKFVRKGEVLPWFKLSRFQDGEMKWTYLPLPFLLLGKVEP